MVPYPFCIGMFGHVWVCVGMNGYVWVMFHVFMHLCKHVLMYLCIYCTIASLNVYI